MEVQQIRCLIPRQKRLLLAPIDNWPAWQRDGHGRSALRPRTHSGFVLMLQSAIFRAGHSLCWMQPGSRATKGKNVGHPKLLNRRVPVNFLCHHMPAFGVLFGT
jgi:hypothetical protein